MRWMICLLPFLLSYLAYLRTDFFSQNSIRAPLSVQTNENLPKEVEKALLQPYRFLGKGRQSYVFVSQDEKTVLKFFKKNYLMEPWYAHWWPGEKEKRELRRQYYSQGYSIATRDQSALLYLHLGTSERRLPLVLLKDQASRSFMVDLNLVPFVVQKKGEPFYEALDALHAEEGKKGVDRVIEQFVSLIGERIEKKIVDRDHDVEHNFGVIDGTLFHLDPGRLLLNENSLDPEGLRKEWWSSTHRFRRWLVEKYPESVSVLDELIDKRQVDVSSSL